MKVMGAIMPGAGAIDIIGGIAWRARPEQKTSNIRYRSGTAYNVHISLPVQKV